MKKPESKVKLEENGTFKENHLLCPALFVCLSVCLSSLSLACQVKMAGAAAAAHCINRIKRLVKCSCCRVVLRRLLTSPTAWDILVYGRLEMRHQSTCKQLTTIHAGVKVKQRLPVIYVMVERK
ncbi:hypothetical protein E2C01_039050 [Portunus trituberculatus]|uniref:Uncharacterized protein n=1 Tax=Portunus trituberculatus TaxID=210409 RepID=A0A5B7FFT8_PORTR|nr:hypothetical protein [Portunus trituberculatus]